MRKDFNVTVTYLEGYSAPTPYLGLYLHPTYSVNFSSIPTNKDAEVNSIK
jgi:hypothetical protein